MPGRTTPETPLFRPAYGLGPGAARRARVLGASLVGTLGILTVLLLPDLILSLPIEVYWFLRHPLLKIGVFLAVLLLGPPRLAGLVPRPGRRGLSGRTRN